MQLHENRFFKCFSDTGVQRLLAHVHETSFLHPTILFEEGQPSDGVFLVLEGIVRLSKNAEGRGLVDIATVHAGDYFGELGVIDSSPRNARAACYGPTRLAVISNTLVLDTLNQEPVKASLKLFGNVLQHLRSANERFITEIAKKEKMQTVGEMASKIIHDFKTPVATIQLATTLILKTTPDPAVHAKCDTIQQETFQIVAMVQELLEFAKGESACKLEAIPVSRLFENFRTLNEDLLVQKKVKLTMRPIDASIRIDLHAMLRVLRNLMSNALEVVPKDAGELWLEAFDRGSFIEISFRDNGPGIPAAIQHTLFDPFVTVGKKNGIGLGLAIVKSVIESHQGEVSFESSGKGASFHIRLKK